MMTPVQKACLQQFIEENLDMLRANPENFFSKVDPGGPVVIILATGSEVRGLKTGRGRWNFSERKNPEYDFLWKGSKAVSPVS